MLRVYRGEPVQSQHFQCFVPVSAMLQVVPARPEMARCPTRRMKPSVGVSVSPSRYLIASCRIWGLADLEQ